MLLSNTPHGTPWAQLQLASPTVVAFPAVPPVGHTVQFASGPSFLMGALEGGGEGWWLVLFTELAWVPQWLIIIFSPSPAPGKLRGFLHSGDLVIVVTGWRPGSGYTNIMRVLTVT